VDFTEGQWPAIKDVFENQVGLSENINLGMRTFGFFHCSFVRYFSMNILIHTRQGVGNQKHPTFNMHYAIQPNVFLQDFFKLFKDGELVEN